MKMFKRSSIDDLIVLGFLQIKNVKLLFLLSLIFLLSSFKSTTSMNTTNIKKNSTDILGKKFANFDIIRSHSDKKKYYLYTLPSKLEVLIIQDANSVFAGASMTVNSGTNKEGKDIYGLAHYCEHMLFLGSKKYDKPTYFVDYVTQHNGKFNGYTEFELTGFFFKINADKFIHSLEIFSRFFLDPLFSEEYVKKEVNSVNSEYERNIQLDSKRKEMIFREIANKESLFHRFSTGNSKTLWNFSQDNNLDLRKRVLEYYKTHYRPDNMKLMVYGNKPVDYYKSLIDKYFAEMEERKDPYEPTKLSEWTKMPWEFHQIGKLVLFKTINIHQDIELTFLIDDVFESLPYNPALYYKILLNYKGKGSLDDILRSKGLIAGIRSYLRKTYKGFSLFKISGYVTKIGIKKLDQVLSVIFKYINFVREKALDEKLYNYVKKAYDVAFFFNKKKKKLIKHIKGISKILWKYPTKYYLTQNDILGPYKKELIEKFGTKLVLNNSIISVGNKSFDEKLFKNYSTFVEGFDKFKKLDTDTVLSKKEPFYLTEFNEFQFKKDFIDSIDSGSESKSVLDKNKLHVFSHKKSLPKVLSLAKKCSAKEKTECEKEMKNDATDLTPTKIKNSDLYELWYKQDRSFYIAKTNFFIKFIFDLDVNDKTYATNIRLLIYALHHHLRNFFFEESLRQNSFQINASANGFSVKIFSFTETLEDTAVALINHISSLKLSKQEFDLVKDEMKNQIKAQMNLVPAMRAYVNFFTLILKDYVENDAILTELDKLKLEEFESFYKELYTKMYLKVFINGTIDKEKALSLFEKVFNIFNKEEGKVTAIKLYKDYMNLHADLSGYFIFREKLRKTYNVNHAVLNFYQIGKETIENIVNANLVKALCGYIYFTELRIKEQLGYTAKGKIFSEGNVIYYMIVVQGSKKTPDFMDLRIENLIELMRKRIEETTDEKFSKFKRTIAFKIGKNDKNLKERTIRLWNEIVTARNYFNMKKQTNDYVKTLKKEDVLKFFNNMTKVKLQKLSVQEFSKKAKSIPKTEPKIRGIKSLLVNDNEYFRKRKTFLANKE